MIAGAPGVFLVVAGLCVGSFVATAALRSVRHEQSLQGRSHCDGCGANLSFLETLPVISYLVLRGRCRSCAGPIEATHFLGEASGGLAAFLALRLDSPVLALLFFSLAMTLLASSIVDWKTFRLPDRLSLLAALLSFALSCLGGAGRLGFGLAAAVLSFCVLEALRRLAAQGGRDPGLGLGDVKLISGLALWLGALTPFMVALAALLGLMLVAVRRPEGGRIAFGPMIALGALVTGYGMEADLWPEL